MNFVPYIGDCRNFSEAINNIKFHLSIPEYYNTAISDYFKEARKTNKPIVNGQEVEWDEYLTTHPDATPNAFIPEMIYKSEDMNQAYTTKTCAEMIEMIENNVPFTFLREQDVYTVIGIYDGYYNEVKEYAPFNADLDAYLKRLNIARTVVFNLYNEMENYHRGITPPDPNKPMSLAEILKMMM